jgi:hypothetical protein
LDYFNIEGGNWAFNDREAIFSGVFCMDTVRIGFVLGKLYGPQDCACNKIKVYITSFPEFGTTFYAKNVILIILFMN